MQNNELAQAMRQGMRRLASGVCVLSTMLENTERFAMTVSSVTSVSDSPASLLVCINQQVSKQEHLSMPGGRFAINVLGDTHRDISDLCAGRDPLRNRFELGQWIEHAGLPVLHDALSVFVCETDTVVRYGTHHIVVALIKEVMLGAQEAVPLVYAEGSYGRFESL